jgi:hypothetical protein
MMEKNMHPMNRFLSLFGLKVSKIDHNHKHLSDNERAFRQQYEDNYKLAERNNRGFRITRTYRYQVGQHPANTQDLEFEFATHHLR